MDSKYLQHGPDWHIYRSDEGRLWAGRCWPDGGGATVSGDDMDRLLAEIDMAEEEWRARHRRRAS